MFGQTSLVQEGDLKAADLMSETDWNEKYEQKMTEIEKKWTSVERSGQHSAIGASQDHKLFKEAKSPEGEIFKALP